MVWPHLKVFWLSKENSAGHSARKKKKKVDRRKGGKTILRSGQGWTLLAQIGSSGYVYVERDCCEVVCGAPTTSHGYGID